MNTLEWLAQALVILLLGAAIPVAWRLQRALSHLRAERDALDAGADGLAEATRAAEAALARLRAGAEQAGRQVAEKVALGEPLREDLRYLIERAESLADRLENGVRAARPLAQEQPVQGTPPPPPAAGARGHATARPIEPRSAAERQLLQALAART